MVGNSKGGLQDKSYWFYNILKRSLVFLMDFAWKTNNMKTLFTILGALLTTVLMGQTFEAVNVPGVSDVADASRSVNFVDVNGDGWDDIFYSNGLAAGQSNVLLINQKDGTFLKVENDPIVLDNDRSDGASFADVDNDGDMDAAVVTFGANGSGRLNYFYRNNGDGSFTHEPANAICLDPTYSEMVTWIDANNDQYLDCMVTNSVQQLANLYYENQGDGSFLKRTDLAFTNEAVPTRGVDWVDYDGDGDSDIYLTNETSLAGNSLYRNDGPDQFTLVEDLTISTDQKVSAGSSWADIDNDGDLDLFVANWDGDANQLYFNNDGVFAEDLSSAIAQDTSYSFGSTFGDVDNDGDLDLFVCNSYLGGQNNSFLYLNDGNGGFSLDQQSDLSLDEGWTFGAAFGDYDNNGWLDIFLAKTQSEAEENVLFKNTGFGNGWVKFLLKGTTSNSSAVGAVVRLTTTINGSTVTQMRQISASSGYCSQNSMAVHFGLADAQSVESVEIIWPSGLEESYTDIAVEASYTVVEGDGISLSTADLYRQPEFKIWPNPAKDLVFLEAALPIDKVVVYNLAGQEIGTYSNHTASISTHEWTPGVYIIIAHIAGAVSVQRLVR